jgi:CelD/BcsL family acetyltransferase involved in cellulose biosynthesis
MPFDNFAFSIDETDDRTGATAPPIEASLQLSWEEGALPLAASPPLGMACAQVPQKGSRSGILLRVHHTLDEVGEEWKIFERQADRSVFQSFAWLAYWQGHIGVRQGTVPAIVTGRDQDGELLFILPLAVEWRWRRRRLTWLGAQLGDCNAPILAERFSDRVSADRFCLLWQDIVGLLRSDQQYKFDWVDLVKMPGAVGNQRNPFLDLGVRPHPVGDEPYKRDWCDGEIELYDYLKPTTPAGVLIAGALKAFRGGKRFVKRSPSLWRAFSKLRTFAARIASVCA